MQPPQSSREVTTWYLEMTTPSELCASSALARDCSLARATSNAAASVRELYARIGRSFAWSERASWSDRAWAAHLARPAIGVFVLVRSSSPERGQEPLGFFELEQASNGDVLLAYLGLVSHVLGARLGGYLLTRAVETAWQRPKTRRIWLRTSSLDAPSALPNYLARGFRIAGSTYLEC